MRVRTEKSVDLSWKDIGDDEARSIAVAVRDTTTLKSISLYHNSIGTDGAEAIAAALSENTTVESLGLGSNRIGDDGAKSMASALERNATLRELYIGNNAIGDDGAKALSASLKKNATLTKLNLYDNSMGDDSARSIRDALINDNKALKNISLRENDIDDALLDEIDAVLGLGRETRSSLKGKGFTQPEERTALTPTKGHTSVVEYDWMAPHRWFPQAASRLKPHTYHLAADRRTSVAERSDGSLVLVGEAW